jgi:hypothetical protein
MGPLLVQDADVVTHELEDFGGIRTAWAVTLNIDEPA